MADVIFRLDELIRLCKDKSVLHLGYIQHSNLYEPLIASNTWVHSNIALVSKEIVGIDYLKDDVEIIRKKYGYEGYYGDASKLNELTLDRKFDVIVCGELIEHIANAEGLLQGMKKFMHDSSIVIITTPNVFGKEYSNLYKQSDEEHWVNKEHITWYSYFTLKNVLARYNFKEVKYDYYFGFETLESHYKTTKPLLRLVKKYYNDIKISLTPKKYQIGLFFIAKL